MEQLLEHLATVGQRFVTEKPLPGMSIGLVTPQNQQQACYLGQIDHQSMHQVQAETIYDLASLTKLYTALAYLHLALDENFALDQPLKNVLPNFNHPEITFKQILGHNSGLPSSVRKTTQLTKAMLENDLYTRELLNTPGTEIHYSDVGYMLLGKALSKVMGVSLEQAMQTLVIAPLQLKETGYRTNAMPEFMAIPASRFAPTEINPDRGGELRGEVDDFKAELLGGAAGHAGIFSTQADTLTFLSDWLRPEMVALLRESRFDFRTLGWHYWRFGGEDFPSVEQDWLYQTGFTGTIMALNLKTNQGLSILSNRVYPNRQVYDWWRVDRYQMPQAFFAQ